MEGKEGRKEGLPLQGIAVRILGPGKGGLGEERVPVLARGRTGKDGSFSARGLPPPPWTVEVAGRDWAFARWTLSSVLSPPRENSLIFRLRPGWTLEGRVREKNSGTPLPGALVKALPLPEGRGKDPAPAREARTGRNGTFRLEGLALRVSYRLLLRREGFRERALPGPFGKGTPFLNLSMESLTSLRVTLLPPRGAPLPARAQLGLLAGRQGEKGPLQLLGLLRTYPWPKGGSLTLPCPGPGFYKVRAEARLPGGIPLAGISDGFRVTGKEVLPPAVTVPLARGGLLEGRVLDGPGGPPLEGVLLWVRGEWRKARTGPGGRFRLPCAAGDRGILVLRIPGKRGAFVPFRLPPGGGRASLGDLVLPRLSGRVLGVLRDSSGRPLEGKRLHLAGPGLEPWNWPVETGRAGRFGEGGLPFGDWEIRLAGKVLERFRLSAGRPAVSLDLTVPEKNP